jgi:predicted nucleotidyltransferase
MMFGLGAADWEILRQECIDPLKDAGAKVWVFGSRARGDYTKFSDIDILYEFQINSKRSITAIKNNLEESRLSIKVDLVSINELADSYKSSVLKERISV